MTLHELFSNCAINYVSGCFLFPRILSEPAPCSTSRGRTSNCGKFSNGKIPYFLILQGGAIYPAHATVKIVKSTFNANTVSSSNKDSRDIHNSVAQIDIYQTVFLTGSGKIIARFHCLRGHSLDVTTQSCTPCLQGRFNPSGYDESHPFNPNNTQACSDCSDCPAGRYGIKDAGTNVTDGCDECPAGEYQNSTDCSAGQYQSEGGKSYCSECAAGSITDTGEASRATNCTPCVAGKYSTASDVASCTDCAAGSITNTGTSAGASTCTECGAGKYSTASDVASCTDCEANKYQNSSKQTSCVGCAKCPAGERQSCAKSFAGFCTDCAPGRFVDALNNGACTDCPKGKYQNRTNEASCIACGN
eukprot:g2902.t1